VNVLFVVCNVEIFNVGLTGDTDDDCCCCDNGVLSSSISPLQTTNSTLTSRSDNCPECRAIT